MVSVDYAHPRDRQSALLYLVEAADLQRSISIMTRMCNTLVPVNATKNTVYTIAIQALVTDRDNCIKAMLHALPHQELEDALHKRQGDAK